jgi:Transmembrane protein 43
MSVNPQKGHHFRNGHQIVGLAIFLLTFPLWVLGRLLMPPKVPSNGNSNSRTSTEQSALISTSGANIDVVDERTSGRTENVFTWIHRLVGGVVLAAGLWEIYSGILMFIRMNDVPDRTFVTAYYIWCCFLIAIVLVLTVVAVIKR